MTDILKDILISDITTNPNQPRQIFKEEDIKALAESIANNGLIQPIIVRPSDIIGYELIAGERRLRAHQFLGKSHIQAIITQKSYQESMKQALIENLQRADLNPIEEAKAYQNIIDKLGMTHQELAKSIGKSRPYISNQLRLLQLSSSWQTAIEEGLATPGHARLILPLSKEEQNFWLTEITGHQISVHQLEKSLKKEDKQPTSKEKTIFQNHLEEELQKSLGLSVSISGFQQKKGHLSITFSNEEEFNRIINKLK
ncbi:ParB/RepB/Spo0J family partition protein [Streptococcus halotolerans]|uniref:ParB/RepB/Spo0J family partition protein n=1 Tax=Streptococcus halotolerans TaxID=1814128 RepID=UPI00078751E4|nr:ParB/RepB/Spo0J family partition protein [Streptococcus halotolerans]